jgi:hypothetical protein
MRGIQYAAAFHLILNLSGILGRPVKPGDDDRCPSCPRINETSAPAGVFQVRATISRGVFATNQTAPADFNVAVGTEIPSALNTYPLPRRAARDVPAVKPYRYAMTQDKVLIINPSDRKIADVVASSK